MPNRFTAFTPQQATQLAREHDRVESIVKLWWKRILLMSAILFFGGVMGTGFALYKVQEASDHADESQALAISVNRQLIHEANLRAVESRKAAAKSASTAYAACRRQQEAVVLNRELYALLRPSLEAHNSPAKVDQLFHDIRAQHGFEIPKCQKPPKGAG